MHVESADRLQGLRKPDPPTCLRAPTTQSPPTIPGHTPQRNPQRRNSIVALEREKTRLPAGLRQHTAVGHSRPAPRTRIRARTAPACSCPAKKRVLLPNCSRHLSLAKHLTTSARYQRILQSKSCSMPQIDVRPGRTESHIYEERSHSCKKCATLKICSGKTVGCKDGQVQTSVNPAPECFSPWIQSRWRERS